MGALATVIIGLIVLLVVGVILYSLWEEWQLDTISGFFYTIIFLIVILLLIFIGSFLLKIGLWASALLLVVIAYPLIDRYFIAGYWRIPPVPVIGHLLSSIRSSRLSASVDTSSKLKQKPNPDIQMMVNSEDGVLQFRGHGLQVSDPVKLSRGRYRIKYKAYNDTALSVNLMDVDDIDSEPENIVFLAAEAGSRTFVLKESGQYAFEIIAIDEDVKWALQIQKLSSGNNNE